MLVLDQKPVLEDTLLVLILAIPLVLPVLLDHMLNPRDLLLLAPLLDRYKLLNQPHQLAAGPILKLVLLLYNPHPFFMHLDLEEMPREGYGIGRDVAGCGTVTGGYGSGSESPSPSLINSRG